MTSGSFTTYPINGIWVNRDKRQRRELRDIDELADSISRTGLIHPIVIRRDGELVVGERRYTAIKQLGWTDVPIQFIEDLPEDELQIVELEENVRRVNLTWQEQCTTISAYHAARCAQEPNWSHAKTGQSLGFSQPAITTFINVAKELQSGNELVKAAPALSTAKNITSRKNEREAQAVISSISSAPTPTIPLIHADFHEWAQTYDGPKFNLIHCDFPYGINYQNSDQASQEYQTYADSMEVYDELLMTLDQAMENVVAESAHLIFWFSMDYYSFTFMRLSDAGWKVLPHPLVWYKNDNTGIIPDANRGPRRIYETAFFASRGDRKIVRAVSNACAWPGQDKSIHKSEKPVGMLQHFMRMVCDEYSNVLDPTCGSGNALKAATACNAARVVGLERDEQIFNIAKEYYFNE